MSKFRSSFQEWICLNLAGSSWVRMNFWLSNWDKVIVFVFPVAYLAGFCQVMMELWLSNSERVLFFQPELKGMRLSESRATTRLCVHMDQPVHFGCSFDAPQCHLGIF